MAKSKNTVKRKAVSKKENDIMDFFLRSSKKSSDKVYKTAKVGIVTALVGGIFKAMALTETFPKPFDTFGNVILFASFLIFLFAFIFFWFVE
jgi:hypothetical protein